MIDFGVSQRKQEFLERRMKELRIREKDITEKFLRSSGPGGRKRDTSATAVYLKHEPTGIEVKCAAERIQRRNRFLARRRLVDKIAARIHGKKTAKQREIEKIRRRKRKRSARSKKKMLEEKKKRAQKKQLRKPPHIPGDEETKT